MLYVLCTVFSGLLPAGGFFVSFAVCCLLLRASGIRLCNEARGNHWGTRFCSHEKKVHFSI
jgi:hypothetical protein